jgi:hypothetical protein
MFYVLVKDGETVISKSVYGGDDKSSRELINKLRQEKPGLTYEESSSEESFNTASVPVPISKTETNWQIEKAKGVSSAIDFIAKELGLE